MTPWILIVTIPVFLASALGIVRVALGLVRSLPAVLARAPLAPSLELEVPAAGEVSLCLEAPRLTFVAGLGFRLRDAADGSELRGERPALPWHVSGVGTTRSERGRYVLPRPGRYRLEVDGVSRAMTDAGVAIALTTAPRSGALVGRILALVVLGALAVGALVASGSPWFARGTG